MQKALYFLKKKSNKKLKEANIVGKRAIFKYIYRKHKIKYYIFLNIIIGKIKGKKFSCQKKMTRKSNIVENYKAVQRALGN